MVNLDSKKTEDLLQLGIILLILINVNLLMTRFSFRFDLTEEKRYTISDASIELLKSLDDVVYIDVYLEGDFPPGFQRLQKAIRQTLEDFRIYAGNNIQYRFVDPGAIQVNKGQQDIIRHLSEKGIQPTNLFATEDGKRTEKLIFPGAVISYGGEERGVMLLKGNKAATAQERLNQSVESVEFELISAIHDLYKVERNRIALIRGHGELDSADIASARRMLLESYDLYNVHLPAKSSLMEYDAIIIAKPKMAFTEEDIYKIDQYIMNGGKAIFMIDMLEVDLDSISREGTIGFAHDLNLDNLFFKYGIRINKDFLLDLNSGGFPVVVGNMGENPQVQMMPWPFYPIISNYADHPLVRNLDALYLKFTSSIDTVKAEGVSKTPLIFTSQYSKTVMAPVPVSLNDLKKEMSPEIFNEGQQAVAYLLQGKFKSVFENRFIPQGFDKDSYKEKSLPASIIVIADGDVIRNEVNIKTGIPYELGYDPYLQADFANEDFISNSLSFLLDEDGLILSRNKEIRIRLLDKIKAENEKIKWQMINLIIPIVLLAVFGVSLQYIRKRKYSR